MPNLPYKTAGWDTHTEVKLREIDYPLEGEPSHFTVLRTYEGPDATYADLAANTPDVEFPAAVFVKQGKRVHVDGDCVRYERLFATIPAQWSERESHVYTYPGIALGTLGTSFAITSIGPGALNELVIGSAITGVTVGENVSVSVRYTRAGVVYAQSFSTPALAVSSGVSVTIRGNLLGSVGSATSVSGTIAEATIARPDPKDIIASSRVVHDYALTSDATIAADLPLFQRFRVLYAPYGQEWDSCEATTSPTHTEYAQLVRDGSELVAECSLSRYLGNIYCRKTRYVPAL